MGLRQLEKIVDRIATRAEAAAAAMREVARLSNAASSALEAEEGGEAISPPLDTQNAAGAQPDDKEGA